VAVGARKEKLWFLPFTLLGFALLELLLFAIIAFRLRLVAMSSEPGCSFQTADG
jgi:hypothetical protein